MSIATEHKINFHPNPLQKQFIESKPLRLTEGQQAPGADLFSSRMGEGKSTALAWSAYYHTKQNPGATWYLIRDTWENIQATTMKTFFEWFPPGIMGTFNATKRMFTWASGVAEGQVGFLGMDDPQDASKLMSRDMAGFGIDEPAPAIGSVGVDEMIFDIAMSRLRQPNMKWYGAKLAENNPDEAHWTYRRFVNPGQEGFVLWQPPNPENTKNLPASYYSGLRQLWAHRPDLIRRFVDGDFGFQQIGKSVTPQWSDKVHLAHGLIPVRGEGLTLLWDWGLNPTCLFTQVTPLGHWNILESFVGKDVGAEELIADIVKPTLIQKYKGYPLLHIGDPQGKQREQTSALRNAVGVMKKALGGMWRPGPVAPEHRIEPLRSVLGRLTGGRGVIQTDRDYAPEVWHALRGGWHYHVARTGITSGLPVKDIHSHPGDAMSYGAAILFPMAKIYAGKTSKLNTKSAQYFGQDDKPFRIGPKTGIAPLTHGAPLPSHR